jgi:hypothetical protein
MYSQLARGIQDNFHGLSFGLRNQSIPGSEVPALQHGGNTSHEAVQKPRIATKMFQGLAKLFLGESLCLNLHFPSALSNISKILVQDVVRQLEEHYRTLEDEYGSAFETANAP